MGATYLNNLLQNNVIIVADGKYWSRYQCCSHRRKTLTQTDKHVNKTMSCPVRLCVYGCKTVMSLDTARMFINHHFLACEACQIKTHLKDVTFYFYSPYDLS